MKRDALIVTLALAALSVPAGQSLAAEWFEGLWAKTNKDCRYTDRPTSGTMIDLHQADRAKADPIFDQYENHCRIDSTSVSGQRTVLHTTCFEFWDDFKKNVDGRKTTISLAPAPGGNLSIDGKRYLRCKAKRLASARHNLRACCRSPGWDERRLLRSPPPRRGESFNPSSPSPAARGARGRRVFRSRS
jgi:hypothetical protein